MVVVEEVIAEVDQVVEVTMKKRIEMIQ